jgi:uncharacterized protein YukJ
MTLSYGFVKCKVVSDPKLQSSRHGSETQYHLHATLKVGSQSWDTAINVGTNDSDDLLQYKLVYDFHHAITTTLRAAKNGFADLTDKNAAPALDFLRTDLLADTGSWRETDVMDGSTAVEPVASLMRLISKAKSENADVYIFGRTYKGGDLGIHDVHMNQGSSGSFLNNGRDDHNDHNAVWQDGGVLVDFGDPKAPEMAAYFTAFTQQNVPTDGLGNPAKGAHGIKDSDDGSLVGKANPPTGTPPAAKPAKGKPAKKSSKKKPSKSKSKAKPKAKPKEKKPTAPKKKPRRKKRR